MWVVSFTYEEWEFWEISTWESTESFFWRVSSIVSMRLQRLCLSFLIGWLIRLTESKRLRASLNGGSTTCLLALTENPILSRSASGTGNFSYLSDCEFNYLNLLSLFCYFQSLLVFTLLSFLHKQFVFIEQWYISRQKTINLYLLPYLYLSGWSMFLYASLIFLG